MPNPNEFYEATPETIPTPPEPRFVKHVLEGDIKTIVEAQDTDLQNPLFMPQVNFNSGTEFAYVSNATWNRFLENFKKIKNLPNIRHAKFGNCLNALPLDRFKDVMVLISMMSSLEHLYLGGNDFSKFSQEHFDELANTLRKLYQSTQPTLLHLNLNKINIAEMKGGKNFFSVLKAVPNLASLHLANNALYHYTYHFYDTLSRILPELKELYLECNGFYLKNENYWNDFLDAINRFPKLEKLSLAINLLDRCNPKHLIPAINRCTKLKELDLSENNFSNEQLKLYLNEISKDICLIFGDIKTSDPEIVNLIESRRLAQEEIRVAKHHAPNGKFSLLWQAAKVAARIANSPQLALDTLPEPIQNIVNAAKPFSNGPS